MEKIRVLVVDDSAFMRKIIPEVIAEDAGIEIVGTAKDGYEALKKIAELNPDVITLDVEMPKLGGLQTLGYIMSENPKPVIMLSAYTPMGAEITMQALEYGAVDFVCKPSGEISIDIQKVQKELIEKIKAAKSADLSKLKFINPELIAKKKTEKEKETKDFILVFIAASTGGPRALAEVISKIPRDIPAAYLLVQHMSAGFTKTLAERLNSQSMLTIKEAEEGDVLKSGHAYLAPGNFHMEIQRCGDEYEIRLNQRPHRQGVRPSGDLTLFSVTEQFEGKMVGVVLTGMGRDTAAGMEKLKAKKGTVIAQDKDSCVIYGMPKAVIESGCADTVAPLSKIADEITKAVKKLAEA